MEIEAAVAHRVAERDAVAVTVHALHRQKAVLAPLQQFPRRIAGQHTVLTTNIPENGIHRNEL